MAVLRDALKLEPAGPEIDLDEVEPAENIMKRFCTGGMSLGAISRETHETISIAMNRINGGWHCAYRELTGLLPVLPKTAPQETVTDQNDNCLEHAEYMQARMHAALHFDYFAPYALRAEGVVLHCPASCSAGLG